MGNTAIPAVERRKKGIDPPKAENFAMVAGHLLEDGGAVHKRESHCHIIKASTDDYTITNTDNSYLRVSPDRTFWRTGQRITKRAASSSAHNADADRCRRPPETLSLASYR